MRRHRALEELARIEDYFKDVSSYATSKAARLASGSDEDFGLTYGETSVNLSCSLLAWSSLSPEDVFCDFGAGAGVPTLVASNLCKEARGIEILSPLVEIAEEAAAALSYQNASFECADFHDADLREVTFLFAYSTCFPASLMEVVRSKALEMKPGSRVLITNHRFAHDELILEKTDFWTWKEPDRDWEMPMEVNLYRRVDTPL